MTERPPILHGMTLNKVSEGMMTLNVVLLVVSLITLLAGYSCSSMSGKGAEPEGTPRAPCAFDRHIELMSCPSSSKCVGCFTTHPRLVCVEFDPRDCER